MGQKSIIVSCKINILLFLTITSISATAQSWQDTSNRIDGILDRFPNSGPIGQLAISRNGQLLYSAARGMSNLEYGIPLSKESKIEAGSISKQFTAACVLLLEQQGKLLITDNIRKYLPEMQDYGKPITISHLLYHTSGIKDLLPIAYLTGWPPKAKTYSNNDYLQFIVTQKVLNNTPGDEYIYSNSNYVLLAIIVERVAKASLSEFSNKHIFIPAGMKNTEWRDDFRKVVSNRSIAYFKRDSGYFTEMPNESSYGHAGLLTTAEDLIRWNDYYLGEKLGSSSMLTKQLATGVLNSGKVTTYAAGLNVIRGKDLQRISHVGLTAGYRASLEHFSQLGLSIAWISNSSQPEVFEIATAVRNLFFGTPQIKTDATIELNTFRQYLGVYHAKETGSFLKLVMEENGIYSQSTGPSQLLKPVSNTTLLMGSQLLKFPSTDANKILLISSSGDTTFYTGIDSSGLDSFRAKEYPGVYTSKEIEGKIIIVNKSGKLFIKLKPDVELSFLPVSKDGFYFRFQNESTGITFLANFERDTKQKIIGFVVSEPRARKISYRKEKENNNF